MFCLPSGGHLEELLRRSLYLSQEPRIRLYISWQMWNAALVAFPKHQNSNRFRGIAQRINQLTRLRMIRISADQD